MISPVKHPSRHHPSDISVPPEPSSFKFNAFQRKIFILITVIILLLVIICIPIFYLYYVIPKQICDEEKRLNFPFMDCRGDGFYDVNYVVNNSCGVNRKRYVKYKFVDDVKNFKLYNFYRAKQECEKLGSTLWEVLDGEPEWNVFIEIAKEFIRSNLWLNAKIVGKCDENKNKLDDELHVPCHQEEASQGHGLEVKWPSFNYTSKPKYSRLIRGTTSIDENPGENCVFVDNTNDHLWDIHDCTSNRYWGLCVKRQCVDHGPE